VEQKFNKTPAKANRWFRAFVVISLLYGITFSLDSIFNWIFFFGAVYSLFMSYFLLPVQPKIFQGNQNRSRQAQWQGPGEAYGAGNVSPQDRAKKVAIIISASIGGLFVFLIVIGLLVGDPENEQQSDRQEEVYDIDSNPAALANRGNEYYNNQQYDSAEIYYNRALALDGDNVDATYGKAIVFDQRGQTSDAAEYYKKAVGLDSTYVYSYSRLAELEPEKQEFYLKLAEKYAN
jgi:tetratricopeptide (TPR) repeat protein